MHSKNYVLQSCCTEDYSMRCKIIVCGVELDRQTSHSSTLIPTFSQSYIALSVETLWRCLIRVCS